MVNVGRYTDKQIIDRIKSLPSFKGFSSRKFIVSIRSKERKYNSYDDKTYCYTSDFVNNFVMSSTTESGSFGVKNWFKWSKKGYAEIKADECYYGVWQVGYHKSKMKALKQVGGFKVIRKKSWSDNNNDCSMEFWKGLNFHCNSYNKLNKAVKWLIGGWSTGCQVTNQTQLYYKYMKTLKKNEKLDYYLLNEF